MEPARPNNELKKTEPPSPELLKNVWVATWLDKTQRRFKQEILAEEKMEDWSRIYDRIGQSAFETALMEGFLVWEFFPENSAILQLYEQMKLKSLPERQIYQLPAKPEDPISPEELKQLWQDVKKAAFKKAI